MRPGRAAPYGPRAIIANDYHSRFLSRDDRAGDALQQAGKTIAAPRAGYRSGHAMVVSARREPVATAAAERRTGAWSLGAFRLQLDVVLQAGLLDQHELCLDEVHAA